MNRKTTHTAISRHCFIDLTQQSFDLIHRRISLYLEHYGAYDHKYGLSLCHAWGASPIYLLGKYYLGVTPTSPGYETFEVKPYLGRFGHIKGTVPINGGSVKIDLTNERLSVIADKDGGTLIFGGNTYPIIANEELVID